VYLAEDTRLSRKVAVKLIAPQWAPTGETLARFHREAAAASRLDHPGICAVYEAGEAEGVHYIAMRYVEGTTLAEAIERLRDRNMPESAPASADGETIASAATAQVATELLAVTERPRTKTTPKTPKTPSTREEIFRVVQLIERAARGRQ
jgi:serine/threonine-protein kinase